jgi:hypothetical protein
MSNVKTKGDHAMMSIVREMEKTKVGVKFIRYDCTEDRPPFTTIYVGKWNFADGIPDKIRVTVEAEAKPTDEPELQGPKK